MRIEQSASPITPEPADKATPPTPPAAATEAAGAATEPAPAATREEAAEEDEGARTAKVDLPFVTAQFRAPHVALPRVPTPNIGRPELAAAVQTARSYLPPPRQALYFGGLVVLAAVEVIEWPVAAAIGIGTAIMGRSRAGSGGKARQGRNVQGTQEQAATVAKPQGAGDSGSSS